MSIQCCAESSYTDPSTNINWISDHYWYSNIGCQNISKPVENDKGGTIRIFGGDLAKKWCYNLSTIEGQVYLIRGTFLYGESARRPLASLFNVSVGVTPIGQVNGSDESVVVEGVFRATNHHTDFCLLKETGNPYISKLELRLLNDTEYLQEDSSSVLKLVKRVDVGNKEKDIRYVSLFFFNPRLIGYLSASFPRTITSYTKKTDAFKLSPVRETHRCRSQKEKE